MFDILMLLRSAAMTLAFVNVLSPRLIIHRFKAAARHEETSHLAQEPRKEE